jgi:hypothetical protein
MRGEGDDIVGSILELGLDPLFQERIVYQLRAAIE